MSRNDALIGALNDTPSKLAMLLVTFFAQVPHTIYVFTDGEKCKQWSCLFEWSHIPALSAGIALEGCVLFVLFRGWHMRSYFFAVVSMCVNVAYFSLANHGGDYTKLTWIEWLRSAIIPVVIAVYSHLLAERNAVSAEEGAGIVARSRAWAGKKFAPIRKWHVLARIYPVAPIGKQLPAPNASIVPVPKRNDAVQVDADDRFDKILAAIRDGCETVYAISKRTGITSTTLKRGDKGLLAVMIANGVVACENDRYVPRGGNGNT